MIQVLLALFLSTASAAVSADETVKLALEHDPALAAAAAEIESASGDLRAASGILLNPQLEVGVLFGDPQSAAGLARMEGQFMQPIPVSGAGRHGTRSARARAEGAEAALSRARLQAAARARQAFLRRALAEAELSITAQNLAGATRLREATAARLAAGDAPELDLQLARLEEASAVAAWLSAVSEVRAARVVWAALTGLDVSEAIEADPLTAAPSLTGEGGSRSDIAAAEAQVRSARAGVARARAVGLPPLQIGVFAEVDASQFAVGPKLSVPLPFKNQNLRAVGNARGALLQAEAELAATTARAQAEQNSAVGELDAAARAVEVLGDELPEIGAAHAAIERGYVGGQFDLGQVLLLRARVIEGERGWYGARAAIARARIEAALARELPSLLGR